MELEIGDLVTWNEQQYPARNGYGIVIDANSVAVLIYWMVSPYIKYKLKYEYWDILEFVRFGLRKIE